MSTSPWSNFGLAWASLEQLHAHSRLAQALLRWEVLPAAARTALRQLVLYLATPPAELAAELAAAQLVILDQPVAPSHPGAALVALDEERRALSPAEASVLLAWYERGLFRLRKTYAPFTAPRPRVLGVVDAGSTFAQLERRKLVEHLQGTVYRSTVRGWGVARLIEDAASSTSAEEDGPTRPRLALQEGRAP